MITPKMVPADVFIPRVAQYLKDNIKEIQPPEWSYFTKTSSFTERVPDNPEIWWYVRAASLLRRLYFISPLGIGETQRIYSGLKRRGTEPPRTVRAPAHANRLIFKQLEKAGLVTRTKKGRVLSPKGRSLLDKLSYEMFKELAEKRPELKKYLE